MRTETVLVLSSLSCWFLVIIGDILDFTFYGMHLSYLTFIDGLLLILGWYFYYLRYKLKKESSSPQVKLIYKINKESYNK